MSGMRCPNACGRIFEHDTARRGNAEALSGCEKYLWIRLPIRHLVAANNDLEVMKK